MQNLTHAYDGVGNVTSITNSLAGPQTQTFTYDFLDRLTQGSATGGSQGLYDENYVYNTIGNLTEKAGIAFTYLDTAHKHAVTHVNGVQKNWYDANGNAITRIVGGNTYNQTYDAENRLVQVGGAANALFTYDGDGNRVKSQGGGTTIYISDYYEKDGTNTWLYYYAGGQRVAMRKNGTLFYLLGDHLGSTHVTADSLGAVGGELRYKPYGDLRHNFGNTPTTFRFTGQRQESQLGLYWYNSRWYDPLLGRFIQADTIVPEPGNPQALNRYSYVLNNPLRYTDPSGYCAQDDSDCWAVSDQLYELFGWSIQGVWSLEEVSEMLTAAQAIGQWFGENGGDGFARMRAAVGTVTIAHASALWEWIRGGTSHVVMNTIYLAQGFNEGTVIHEIGHVLENNLSANPLASILFGVGPSDLMARAVGGTPEGCFLSLRFFCAGYKTATEDPPTRHARSGPSEDFAETFRLSVNSSPILETIPQRAQWMKNFASLLVDTAPEYSLPWSQRKNP